MGVADLDPNDPLGTAEAKYGATQLRAIKAAIRATFAAFTAGADVLTRTAAQLNNAPDKTAAETISGAWAFTAPVTVPVGSSSAPSVAFAGDSNTGIYSEGANVLNFATEGAERVSITGTEMALQQPIHAADGVVASPSYSFSNDPNTGIRRHADGVMAFVTNSSDTFVISPGFVTVQGQEQIYDGSAGTPAYSFSNETSTGLFRRGASQVGLSLAGGDQYKFTTAGLEGPATGVASGDNRYSTNAGVKAYVDAEITKIASYASLRMQSAGLTATTPTELAGGAANPNAVAAYSEVSAGSGRLTANTTGGYRVDFCGQFSNAGAANSVTLEIRKNGGALTYPLQTSQGMTTATYYVNISLSGFVDLAATDFLSLYYTNGTGDYLSLTHGHFSLQRVR